MLQYNIAFLLVFVVSILIKNYKLFYKLILTFHRDYTEISRYLKVLWRLPKVKKNQETLLSMFDTVVKKHPNKIVFYFENEKWTYRELDIFTSQIAHYFKNKGYKKGDCVSLLLENRPDYVGIWLGLSKIGVITSLINTNLVSTSLIHSIKVANSKSLIFGSDFSKTVSSIKDSIQDIDLFEYNDDFIRTLSKEPSTLPEEIKTVQPGDTLCYVYTSGTTGLPKAARLSHKRLIQLGLTMRYVMDFNENDTLYNPLPLYHAAGGLLAISQILITGMTIVLRRKFSVTNYWTDCETFNCTIANYIGEICRYLLAVHKPGTPIRHNVKKMYGNGLRPQIWDEFINTFKIQHMFEVYGSTEGNAAFVNLDNKIGAVGSVPIWAKNLIPEALISCDQDTGEPIRNNKGYCTKCESNEPGLLVAKISSFREFLGYTDDGATKKKILRDVFVKGDRYFNTGDIMVFDDLGYLYFKDRIGDTFRWKGENVATGEVEGVINNFLTYHDVIVYGVEVPGTEGRAGMAAIVDQENVLDIKKLAEVVKTNLPSYAIPMFIRILKEAPITGTFKLQKVDLKKEGFDVNKIDDQLYFYNSKLSQYVPLNTELYNSIINGIVRI